jgi:hypothetical protein
MEQASGDWVVYDYKNFHGRMVAQMVAMVSPDFG